ncbi:GrpB family protein [Mycolicibacterium sp. P1-18]|nr:GrpB family protein [Mycolicibacterium sp. P1-18]
MPVQLVEHDPAWSCMFAEERDRLQIILQPWLRGSVEHVGSTAVPDLPAKPVVDVAVPVTSVVDAHGAIPSLREAGWLYWPSDPNRSWRLWFLRPRPEARTHHLYLIGHDDPHLRELTAFRDRLRGDEVARERYAELKSALAMTHRFDRDAYTAAKTAFIAELLGQAGIVMQDRAQVAADASGAPVEVDP